MPSDDAKITRFSSLVIGACETRPPTVAIVVSSIDMRVVRATPRRRAVLQRIIEMETYGLLTGKAVLGAPAGDLRIRATSAKWSICFYIVAQVSAKFLRDVGLERGAKGKSHPAFLTRAVSFTTESARQHRKTTPRDNAASRAARRRCETRFMNQARGRSRSVTRTSVPARRGVA
ncbi:hypothetical protein [Paraburkholderia sp. J41]|uniref:hypothetical protein n=1 Tax=Paraburkholderia sp. J41 TaxID=2805433 RepID=UPI002AC34C68|nr:hypothetical protein [Paraburkholderia sp. J41]